MNGGSGLTGMNGNSGSNRVEVFVVRTGTANLASVLAGFQRIGVGAHLTDSAEIAREAELLVLPGVGAFGAAADSLRRGGLMGALSDRVRRGRPLLAICLGLQLLFEESEESPGARGLGILPGRVGRFPSGVRVPQLGWNLVEPDPACRLLTRSPAYFANSYRATEVPEGWSAAYADHGGRFIAAIERGSLLACQFHPELSGTWGRDLLRRWLYNAAGVPLVREASC